MVASKETQAYRQDVRTKGAFMTPKQREDLLKPYLPPTPTSSPTSSPKRKSISIHQFFRAQIHILVFTIIHALFSLFIRIRQTAHVLIDRIFAVLYYHHRAPELIKQDVRGLSRLPCHLSVILELKGEERGSAGLEGLMDEVAEISAWCACVGIQMLSVYERTGRQLWYLVKKLKPGLIIHNRYLERSHPHCASYCCLENARLLRSPRSFTSAESS